MANTFADLMTGILGNSQGKAAELVGRSRTKNGQDGSAAMALSNKNKACTQQFD